MAVWVPKLQLYGVKANFPASSEIAFVAHLAAITYVETQRIML